MKLHRNVKQNSVSDAPFIFKVEYTSDHHSFERFSKLKADHGSFLGNFLLLLSNINIIILCSLPREPSREFSLDCAQRPRRQLRQRGRALWGGHLPLRGPVIDVI